MLPSLACPAPFLGPVGQEQEVAWGTRGPLWVSQPGSVQWRVLHRCGAGRSHGTAGFVVLITHLQQCWPWDTALPLQPLLASSKAVLTRSCKQPCTAGSRGNSKHLTGACCLAAARKILGFYFRVFSSSSPKGGDLGLEEY